VYACNKREAKNTIKNFLCFSFAPAAFFAKLKGVFWVSARLFYYPHTEKIISGCPWKSFCQIYFVTVKKINLMLNFSSKVTAEEHLKNNGQNIFEKITVK